MHMADSITEKVIQAVKQFDMLEEENRVIVGLSGGADSVALLYCLKSLEKILGIKVYACHVNHNLRGKESDGDQAYTESLCKDLGIELRVFSVDVMGVSAKHKSIEEKARELRYEAFCNLSRELGAKVATAHNACDNTETVLMNMLRGTGLKGLCGIPPKRDYLIRPLIYCSREEIEDYCKENKLKYVTDKTNFSTDYTRNKIRIELIPKLLEINPSLFNTIRRMTYALSVDSGFLENMARDALDKAGIGDGIYETEFLRNLPEPVFTRAVSLMLKEKNIEPTSLRINGFGKIIRTGHGKINIEKNKFAVVKKGKAEIQFIPQKYRQINT